MLSSLQEQWFSISHLALPLSFTLGSAPSLSPLPCSEGAGQSCPLRELCSPRGSGAPP